MAKVFSNILQKKIDAHDVISFDIFDTLIKRNCNSPTDVFEIVEKEYNSFNEKKISNFKEIRISAEEKARRNNSELEDITLDEIYNEIDYEANIIQKLKELEINVEISICQTNYQMYEVYQYCLKKEKKIVCISDMYLPIDVIKKILKGNNYNIEKVFLSSELRKTKLSGSLFDSALKQINIEKKVCYILGIAGKLIFYHQLKLEFLHFI